MKIRVDSTDRLFSTYIRLRDGLICQRCKRQFYPGNTRGLDCAHIVVSRRHMATRFMPENAISLCMGCHFYLDSHPEEKRIWYIKKFGKKKWNRVTLHSRVIKKKDKTELEARRIWLREAIQELSD